MSLTPEMMPAWELLPNVKEQAVRIAQLEAERDEAKQCWIQVSEDWRRACARIAQLEAALRAVMDDLTLIGENHWLPVGLLDDVIYVNARAALEERT